MKQKKKKSTVTFIMMGLMMLSLVVSGCSDKLMQSIPVADEPQIEFSDEPKILGRNMEATPAQLSGPNLYTEQIVSSLSGATITLYDVTLIVPPLAVDNDTLFSISIPDASLFYNEFGTNGLQFNLPVTVIMNYRDADLSGIDETTIRLAWFDENDQSWQDMQCTVDFISKTVTGQLDHFSSYGLISD